MNKYEQIKELIANSEEDFNAFYNNGNKAAGTRVRKTMLEIKNIALDVRKEVSEMKNS